MANLVKQYKNDDIIISPDEIMQDFVKDGNAAIREYMLSSAAIAEKEKNETDSLRILSSKLHTQLFDTQKDEIAELVDNVRMYLLLNELPFEIPFDFANEEEEDKKNKMEFHLSEYVQQQMAEAQEQMAEAEQQMAEAQEQVDKVLKQLAQAQRRLEETKKEVKKMQAQKNNKKQ